MHTSIGFKEACELQNILAGLHLTGACVSAGRLVIVEINAPLHASVQNLVDLLKEENDALTETVNESILSCVRRYPDGSLKIEIHFNACEEAGAFLEIARRGMCVSGQS